MARATTLSGEIVTTTEYQGGDTTKRHWYIVSGTFQGVVDFLNENGIPEHKVKGTTLGTTCYIMYHK